jgi:hypothetical protein
MPEFMIPMKTSEEKIDSDFLSFIVSNEKKQKEKQKTRQVDLLELEKTYLTY